MRNKYLLGATKENEIVFGEFEIKHPRFYSEEKGYYSDDSVLEFSASFYCVRPFSEDEIDLETYFEEYADRRCFGDKFVLDQLERFDCSPSELPSKLADECCDPRDALDCSLYPEQFNIDGTNYYFESVSCGKCDTRDEMEIYVDKDIYNRLHEIWDEYHLKTIPKEIAEEVEELINELSKIDEEEWITNYIVENIA